MMTAALARTVDLTSEGIATVTSMTVPNAAKAIGDPTLNVGNIREKVQLDRRSRKPPSKSVADALRK